MSTLPNFKMFFLCSCQLSVQSDEFNGRPHNSPAVSTEGIFLCECVEITLRNDDLMDAKDC